MWHISLVSSYLQWIYKIYVKCSFVFTPFRKQTITKHNSHLLSHIRKMGTFQIIYEVIYINYWLMTYDWLSPLSWLIVWLSPGQIIGQYPSPDITTRIWQGYVSPRLTHQSSNGNVGNSYIVSSWVRNWCWPRPMLSGNSSYPRTNTMTTALIRI